MNHFEDKRDEKGKVYERNMLKEERDFLVNTIMRIKVRGEGI